MALIKRIGGSKVVFNVSVIPMSYEELKDLDTPVSVSGNSDIQGLYTQLLKKWWQSHSEFLDVYALQGRIVYHASASIADGAVADEVQTWLDADSMSTPSENVHQVAVCMLACIIAATVDYKDEDLAYTFCQKLLALNFE